MKPSSILRGLLFHGRFLQIFIYWYFFKKLDNAIRSEKISAFVRENISIKLSRAEQRIEYGCTLSKKQREKLELIAFEIQPEISQGLMLGRYINKTADIKIKKPLEYLLITASLSMIILVAAWLIQLLIGLSAIQPISTSSTITILLTLAIIFSPILALLYISLYPYISYRRYLKLKKKGI